MKTTIEIPDDLFRRFKAASALQGRSLKAFMVAALREKLERGEGDETDSGRGWMRVFGSADGALVSELDAAIQQEFSAIDSDSWR